MMHVKNILLLRTYGAVVNEPTRSSGKKRVILGSVLAPVPSFSRTQYWYEFLMSFDSGHSFALLWRSLRCNQSRRDCQVITTFTRSVQIWLPNRASCFTFGLNPRISFAWSTGNYWVQVYYDIFLQRHEFFFRLLSKDNEDFLCYLLLVSYIQSSRWVVCESLLQFAVPQVFYHA